MSAFVWGLCDDAPHAQRAVTALIEGSFPPGEISVRARDEHGDVESVPIRHKTAAPVGAGIGAIVGAGTAALAVSGAAAGSVDGTLALGVLEVVVAGALTGAGLGAYGGLYFWTQRVAARSEESPPGGVLVGVTVPVGRAPTAVEILRRVRAREVQTSDIDRSGRPVADASGEAAELLSRPVRQPVREPRGKR